jgi:hypothetical protein
MSSIPNQVSFFFLPSIFLSLVLFIFFLLFILVFILTSCCCSYFTFYSNK